MLTGKLSLTYIIGTYPLLTTTFIDREIKMLRQWGVELQIVAIRRPAANTPLSADQRALQQGVHYLLPVAWLSLILSHLYFALLRPRRFVQTLVYLLTRPHPSRRARLKTVLHFGEGVYAAYVLRSRRCDHLHAHFVDRAATVALVASRLLDLPYSVTAHANDIYVNPVLLVEKLAAAKFVATCSAYNQAYLSRLADDHFQGKVKCIYHGLEVKQYQPEAPASAGRPLVLAVGQLKEKKGFPFLLAACRRLKDRGYDFDCQIVGEGPLRQALEAQIRRLALEETVTLCGALSHSQVIEKYRQATVFVLPAVLGENGDRDGIPNVILEAMAMQLPIVSTRHSGIPEAVEDNVSGALVSPGDEAALAEALAHLLDSPERRRQWGRQGRQTVIEKFSAEQNAQSLLAEFTAERLAG